MVGDFGWEHEGTKSRVGTVKWERFRFKSLSDDTYKVTNDCFEHH